ncbi:hypothetical protein ACFWDI_40820 [Streptomyces sp. NPDC060064]|uniref:hypothetical protein n=1 Tax=Streptomyces sp. NPDC060064 TaxID=3347049 RepID=UPI0036A22A04
MTRVPTPGPPMSAMTCTDRTIRPCGRKSADAVIAGQRSGMALLASQGRPRAEALHQAVVGELGSPTGSVGVGGRCDVPDGIPRSFQAALRALEVRQRSRSPNGTGLRRTGPLPQPRAGRRLPGGQCKPLGVLVFSGERAGPRGIFSVWVV